MSTKGVVVRVKGKGEARQGLHTYHTNTTTIHKTESAVPHRRRACAFPLADSNPARTGTEAMEQPLLHPRENIGHGMPLSTFLNKIYTLNNDTAFKLVADQTQILFNKDR